MTKIVYGNSGFDLASAFSSFDDVKNGTITSETPNEIDITGANTGFSYVATGSNFSYTSGIPTGGTLKELSISDGSHKLIDISGLSIKMSKLTTWESSNDTAAFMHAAFGHNNTWVSGKGSDTMLGSAAVGSGTNKYQFHTVADSTSVHHDTIIGVNFETDSFYLHNAVDNVDAALKGKVSAETIDTQVATIVSDTLGAHDAELIHVTKGDLKHEYILVVDQNGHAGYQAGKDILIDLHTPVDTAALTTGSFHTFGL